MGANPDRKALDDLVQSTRRLVGEYFPGDTWIVSAMAQRASVKTKIDGAIGCVTASREILSRTECLSDDRVGMKSTHAFRTATRLG